jgi:hypothetical protein
VRAFVIFATVPWMLLRHVLRERFDEQATPARGRRDGAPLPAVSPRE